MNYAAIKPFDVANGPGVRVSLFVSGCTHRCKNCFNQEAWDFNYGDPFTEKEEQRILEEKIRQGQGTLDDKIKLEKVKKEAKVTTGAVTFKDLYNDIISLKKELLNKLEFDREYICRLNYL